MVQKFRFFWLETYNILPLHSTSRSRAAVARRAHNPKVGGSIPPFATKKRYRASVTFFFMLILAINYFINTSLKMPEAGSTAELL